MSAASPPTAMAVPDPRAWLQEHVDLVRIAVARVARRRRIPAQDRDELLSQVWARLTRNDYRALREYRGTGPGHAYLAVVAERLLLDWRTSQWGKWRASALARRAGVGAVRFERLVLRDGHTIDQAQQMLADTSGTTLAEATIDRLLVREPRSRRQMVDAADVGLVAGGGTDPWCALVDAERDRAGARVGEFLECAVRRLPRADRVLLGLRHEQGLKVSHIAALLGADQKQLYRRLAAIHAGLGRALVAHGLSRDQVADIVGGPVAHVPRVLCRVTRVTNDTRGSSRPECPRIAGPTATIVPQAHRSFDAALAS